MIKIVDYSHLTSVNLLARAMCNKRMEVCLIKYKKRGDMFTSSVADVSAYALDILMKYRKVTVVKHNALYIV